MIYFLKFLIIYLLFLHLSKATEDFDDYDYYVNDDRKFNMNRRQTHNQHIPDNFIGSNLFGAGVFSKQCFSVEDVALLATRSKFEALIPNTPISSLKLENDKSVEIMLGYFYGLDELLSIIEKKDVKFFSQQAFYDVVGGYLNSFYWPLVKYSFYAGMLTYNSTVSVYSLHKHCKEVLNTMGNGWRQSNDYFHRSFKIEPINQSTNANGKNESIVPSIGRDNACENLLLVTDEEDNYRFETGLIVSLPQIEADESDGMLIRLPFKRKQNFNFNSKASAFVLLKYFVTVSQCYAFRKQAPERFEVRFLKLVNEKFLPLLQRDGFYPGFGAILRICERLNRKSLVTRDIEDEIEIFKQQSLNNQTDSNNNESDDYSNHSQGGVYESEHNETSFFEQVIHFIGHNPNMTDKNKKIEFIFFTLTAAVIAASLIIICFCIIRKSIGKNRNIKSQHKTEAKRSHFKSFFKGFNKKKREQHSRSSVSESNIGPHSSSILIGNDFDDTESRVSSQTKTSGLSLKELIHAEIIKRPSKPSKEQIKALSRSTKKLTSTQMTDLLEHS